MSREFKFKCWDKELKYWLKPDDMPTLMSGEIGAVWEFGGEEDYIFCQYTGLKDKNGKEIYEGDIIRSTSEIVELISGKKTGKVAIDDYIVEYFVDEARWATKQINIPKDRMKYEAFALNQERITKYYEVIGNIHENPELLTHPAEGRNGNEK